MSPFSLYCFACRFSVFIVSLINTPKKQGITGHFSKLVFLFVIRLFFLSLVVLLVVAVTLCVSGHCVCSGGSVVFQPVSLPVRVVS